MDTQGWWGLLLEGCLALTVGCTRVLWTLPCSLNPYIHGGWSVQEVHQWPVVPLPASGQCDHVPLNQCGGQSRDRPGSPWLNFPEIPLHFYSLGPLAQGCPLFCPVAENTKHLQFLMLPQGGAIKAWRPQPPRLPQPVLWVLSIISRAFLLPEQLNVEILMSVQRF